MLFDETTELGARIAHRLKEEEIVWLTTTGQDGTPHPRPVWFLWDGSTFLIFSQPGTAKLRDIARNPHVAVNFNTDDGGGDVTVFTGEAEIMDEPPSKAEIDAYTVKYREGIESLEMTPRQMLASYSVAVRVRPTRMYGA